MADRYKNAHIKAARRQLIPHLETTCEIHHINGEENVLISRTRSCQQLQILPSLNSTLPLFLIRRIFGTRRIFSTRQVLDARRIFGTRLIFTRRKDFDRRKYFDMRKDFTIRLIFVHFCWGLNFCVYYLPSYFICANNLLAQMF
jgi:hypothetical protein